jgi:excisionase family DNA binding protein
MEDFMSAKDAAEVLGVTRARVHQLIQQGTLPTAGFMGGAYVLHRSDVERLAKEGWPGRRPAAGSEA